MIEIKDEFFKFRYLFLILALYFFLFLILNNVYQGKSIKEAK